MSATGSQTEPQSANVGKEATHTPQRGSGPFANLVDLKRGTQNPETSEKKASLHEQSAAGTTLGQLWDGYVKGVGTAAGGNEGSK